MSVKWLEGGKYDSDKLVTRYVHKINKETYMTNLDIATGVYTSASHGLTNNMRLIPFVNLNAGKVHPYAVFPSGMVTSYAGYWVVNATTNTFQLANSQQGTPITYTSAGDLTKWHFESNGVSDITVSGLPPRKRYRCILYGRTASNIMLVLAPFSPYDWDDGSSIRYADSTFGEASIASSPNYFMYVEAYFDSNTIAKASYRGQTINIATNPNFTTTNIDTSYVFTNTSFIDSLITGFKYRCGEMIANDTVLEVYEV